MTRKTVLLAMAALAAVELLACAATGSDGKRCTRKPCSGSKYCWVHGGTDAAKKTAKKSGTDPARSQRRSAAKKSDRQSGESQGEKDKSSVPESGPVKVEAVTRASPVATKRAK